MYEKQIAEVFNYWGARFSEAAATFTKEEIDFQVRFFNDWLPLYINIYIEAHDQKKDDRKKYLKAV